MSTANRSARELYRRSRRAFVVQKVAHYGLSRMFQVYCELEGREFEVFRDLPSAAEWLDRTPSASGDAAPSPPE
ncbi:MAG: hypothetical protein ACRENB_14410 [Gemmatimonadales bacterium]